MKCKDCDGTGYFKFKGQFLDAGCITCGGVGWLPEEGNDGEDLRNEDL